MRFVLLTNIIPLAKARKMRWLEHVISMREKRNASEVLVGKPEAKRPLGRPN